MLYITLREGDYFMIGGDIKVTYERTAGRDSMYVGVEAPREVPVKRGQVYESEIAKLAEAGDKDAIRLRRELLAGYEKRVKKYNARRASRREHNRRIEAGEIRTPEDWGEGNEETRERYLARTERDRVALAGEGKASV